MTKKDRSIVNVNNSNPEAIKRVDYKQNTINSVDMQIIGDN